MTTYRLTPLRGSGWHRLGLLAAVGFLPVTVMLWSTGAFGGGEIGLTSAVIFYVAALVLTVVFAFGMGWALKGFAVRTHGEDGEEEERPHRREGPGAGPAAGHGHAPAAAGGHGPAAAAAHPPAGRGGAHPPAHR
ncbi:hypothetical protein [Caenispirillum bisanense]|uniref:hypothetical protein n=1 Tax=Caenispirillum bisanense TaxID=414052 RepID=UPI0031DC38C6